MVERWSPKPEVGVRLPLSVPFGYGVIGSTTDFESVSRGSNPFIRAHWRLG